MTERTACCSWLVSLQSKPVAALAFSCPNCHVLPSHSFLSLLRLEEKYLADTAPGACSSSLPGGECVRSAQRIDCFGRLIDIVALSSLYCRFSRPLDRRYFIDISTRVQLNVTFLFYLVCAGLVKGLRGPCLKGSHLRGTRHQEAQHGRPDPRCTIAGRCATILMATQRILGVLEGGFGDEPIADDLPQTNFGSCAAQSQMLHVGLKKTTIA